MSAESLEQQMNHQATVDFEHIEQGTSDFAQTDEQATNGIEEMDMEAIVTSEDEIFDQSGTDFESSGDQSSQEISLPDGGTTNITVPCVICFQFYTVDKDSRDRCFDGRTYTCPICISRKKKELRMQKRKHSSTFSSDCKSLEAKQPTDSTSASQKADSPYSMQQADSSDAEQMADSVESVQQAASPDGKQLANSPEEKQQAESVPSQQPASTDVKQQASLSNAEQQADVKDEADFSDEMLQHVSLDAVQQTEKPEEKPCTGSPDIKRAESPNGKQDAKLESGLTPDEDQQALSPTAIQQTDLADGMQQLDSTDSQQEADVSDSKLEVDLPDAVKHGVPDSKLEIDLPDVKKDEGVSVEPQESDSPDASQLSVASDAKQQAETESQKEKFTCSECGKTFKTKRDVTRHHLVHTGEKPFPCGVCGKAFSQKSGLQRHQLMHTQERPHKCEICGLTLRGHLARHMKSHSDEKPFKCELCSKGFLRSEDIKKHLRSHIRDGSLNLKNQTFEDVFNRCTALKIYKCALCDKTYTSMSDLKQHKETHANDQLYTCETCSKQFIQKSRLERHLQEHMDKGFTGLLDADGEDNDEGDSQYEDLVDWSSLPEEEPDKEDEQEQQQEPETSQTDIMNEDIARQLDNGDQLKEKISHVELCESCGGKIDESAKIAGLTKCESCAKRSKRGQRLDDIIRNRMSPVAAHRKRKYDDSEDECIAQKVKSDDVVNNEFAEGENMLVMDSPLHHKHGVDEERDMEHDGGEYGQSGSHGDMEGQSGDAMASLFDQDEESSIPVMLVGGQMRYSCMNCGDLFVTVEELREHVQIHMDDQGASSSEHTDGSDTQDGNASDFLQHVGLRQRNSNSETGDAKENAQFVMNTMSRGGRPKGSTNKIETSKDIPISLEPYGEIFNPSKKYPCHICGKELKGGHLIRHLRNHVRGKPYKCHLCPKACTRDLELQRHIRVHHSENPTKLRKINLEELPNGADLIKYLGPQAHQNQPEGSKQDQEEVIRPHPCTEDRVNCGLCGYACCCTNYITFHMEKHTTRMVPCDKCATSIEVDAFSEQSPDGGFLCDICKSRSKKKIRLHEILRNCMNPEKSSSSLSLGEKDSERESSSKRKSHRCPHCSRSYSSAQYLRDHIKIHTGEMSYDCTLCDAKFSNSRNLQRHMQTHDPQNCPICGKSIGGHMARHLKTHSGERPYKCEFCLRDFIRREHLQRHMATHVDGKGSNYNCNICGAEFLRKDHMRRHVKRHQQLLHSPGDLVMDIKKEVDSDSQPDDAENEAPSQVNPNVMSSGKKRSKKSKGSMEKAVIAQWANKEDLIEGKFSTKDEALVNCSPSKERLAIGRITTNDEKSVDIQLVPRTLVDRSMKPAQQNSDLNNIKFVIKEESFDGEAKSEKYSGMQLNDNDKKDFLLDDHVCLQIPAPCDICHEQCCCIDGLLFHVKSHEMITVLCSKCRRNFTVSMTAAIARGYDSTNGYSCKECKPIDSKAEDVIDVLCVRCQCSFAISKSVAVEDGYDSMEGYSCEECKMLNHYERSNQGGQSKNDKEEEEDLGRAVMAAVSATAAAVVPNEEGRYACPECGKSFKVRKDLRRHLVIHSKVKPFACQFCDKTFAQSQGLRRHVAAHAGIKTHECPVCHKTFSGHMKRHMLTHSSDKNLTCNYCQKGFNRREHLNRHLRSHFREEDKEKGVNSVPESPPKPCPICSKLIRGGLARHVQTHFQERAHQCEHCDKSFSRMDHLRRHMNVHNRKNSAADGEKSTENETEAEKDVVELDETPSTPSKEVAEKEATTSAACDDRVTGKDDSSGNEGTPPDDNTVLVVIEQANAMEGIANNGHLAVLAEAISQRDEMDA